MALTTGFEAVEATVDALNAGDAEVVASLTSSVVTELAAAGVQVEITGVTSEEVAKEPAADASDSWITPVAAVTAVVVAILLVIYMARNHAEHATAAQMAEVEKKEHKIEGRNRLCSMG